MEDVTCRLGASSKNEELNAGLEKLQCSNLNWRRLMVLAVLGVLLSLSEKVARNFEQGWSKWRRELSKEIREV
jgi:hypothetical protein